MARLIRRQSMERLELYDLDKLVTNQLPPPLPPPRKSYSHRRASVNSSVERYQFLCNTTRNKTDPIYAATPMFTTIPQTSEEKSHRQLLGAYIPLENVTPLPLPVSELSEPKKVEVVEDKENEDEKENDDEEKEENVDEEKDENTDDDNKNQISSSSSSDEEENTGNDDDDDDDDDKDKKGVVEQIFNRDKKD